jgi:hypothetical protein
MLIITLIFDFFENIFYNLKTLNLLILDSNILFQNDLNLSFMPKNTLLMKPAESASGESAELLDKVRSWDCEKLRNLPTNEKDFVKYLKRWDRCPKPLMDSFSELSKTVYPEIHDKVISPAKTYFQKYTGCPGVIPGTEQYPCIVNPDTGEAVEYDRCTNKIYSGCPEGASFRYGTIADIKAGLFNPRGPSHPLGATEGGTYVRPKKPDSE